MRWLKLRNPGEMTCPKMKSRITARTAIVSLLEASVRSEVAIVRGWRVSFMPASLLPGQGAAQPRHGAEEQGQ